MYKRIVLAGIATTLPLVLLGGCGVKETAATEPATRQQLPTHIDPATGKPRDPNAPTPTTTK